jgi:DNA-binding response OmpR family regulator
MKCKYKVMIVDEDEEITGTLKSMIEQETYKVETAHRANEALKKIKSDKYHIVIIDIEMAEMNGIELLKAIKSYDSLTQVIMMSKSPSMENKLSSLEYGANDYILISDLSMEHVLQVVDISVQKLERWREAIVQTINNL